MKPRAADWQSVLVDGSAMRMFVARPAAPVSSAPAIIVFQEAFGVNAHIREVTQRIAALGYVAVAPELFHRTAPGFEGDYTDLGKSMPHMQALTNDKLEADINAVFAWLQADGQADAARIAALGFCLGGKAAFIANAVLHLKAAASFYGSSIPSLLQTYTSAQTAPFLLVWGGQDKHIDAAKRASVAESLRQAGKSFTQLEFSEVGHGFFCDERASYHAEAAHESWALLTVYLQHRLQDAAEQRMQQ